MSIVAPRLLDGCQWPARWRGRSTFVVLDLGFGLGEHFLATWAAWHDDSRRCDRLVVVALADGTPGRGQLTRAHQGSPWPALAARLLDAWPPGVAGWHSLVFCEGHVRLMLRLGSGPAAQALRELPLQADAIVIGAQVAPDDPRGLARALARAAAPGATLVADGLAPDLQRQLRSSGFDLDAGDGAAGAAALSIGRYAPRFAPRAAAPAAPCPTTREALVIGAGLAGAATAAALAGWGWTTQVLDRLPVAAAGTSGNPAGLYHGIVHGSDGPHARLFRAAALFAQRCYEPLIASGQVAGGRGGLLRLADEDTMAMQLRLASLHLPPEHVQALDAATASALAGVPLPGPAWWYPGGGWLSPVDLVQAWLATPGVHFRGGVDVTAIQRGGPGWQALDGTGQVLAQAAVLVLAGAEGSPRLLAPHGEAGWPLQRWRGQVSGWATGSPHPLRLPVAGNGYALPLSGQGLLCGATSDLEDGHATPRDADDARNFARLARLTGLAPPARNDHLLRRVGWRLQSADRLPIVGALAAPGAVHEPLSQLHRVPRTSGLFVLTALGSRGITLAPLLGELIASMAEGAPLPMERRLADALDPARWLVRAARRAGEAPPL